MGLFSKFIAIIKGTNDFSPADWAELEQELLASDLGPTLTKNFLVAAKKVKSENAELALLEILTSNLSKNSHEPVLVAGTTTIMVVGVNGTGKTTSVAKLASYYKKSGKSVVLAAGDTFRAAAVDQLKTWGNRIGVLVISGKDNSDPASVAFDGAKNAHESAFSRKSVTDPRMRALTNAAVRAVEPAGAGTTSGRRLRASWSVVLTTSLLFLST